MCRHNTRKMKKGLKITGIILGIVIVLLILTGFISYSRISNKVNKNYDHLGIEAPVLTMEGIKFRDLNKNGKLDVYEDKDASIDDRVDDLLSQMSLEEKAGVMFINMIGMTPEGEPIDKPFLSSNPLDIMMFMMLPSSSEMLVNKKMNSFKHN